MNIIATTIKNLLGKRQGFNKIDEIIIVLDVSVNRATGRIKGEVNKQPFESKMDENGFPPAITDNYFFKRWLRKVKEETHPNMKVVVIYLDYINDVYYLEPRWTDNEGLIHKKQFYL
jgi:hypothetical protein